MDIQQLQAAKRIHGNMKAPVLRQGDIVQGKIVTLYPEQRAQILLRSQTMTAQLETPLVAGEQYHFYVQSTDRETKLQVLGDKLNGEIGDQVTQLMRQLGMKSSKQHKLLVEELMLEKAPFTKTQLGGAFSLIDGARNKTQARQAIVHLLVQRKPLTTAVFNALYTKNTSEISTEIESLMYQLNKNPETGELQENLIERISVLIGQPPLFTRNPNAIFIEHLRHVLQFTGLSHENHEGNSQQVETIKSMVLQLVNNSDGNVRDRAQQVLHFINGLQLDSVDETPNMIQANLQLPGEKLGLNRDVHLDFSGKKTKTGKISTDHCRILFYLDLKQLRETVIDMNIQKRAVRLTVYNDHRELEERLMALKPTFKDTLYSLEYHLSTIAVKPLNQMEKAKTGRQTHVKQGVDFRI